MLSVTVTVDQAKLISLRLLIPDLESQIYDEFEKASTILSDQFLRKQRDVCHLKIFEGS